MFHFDYWSIDKERNMRELSEFMAMSLEERKELTELDLSYQDLSLYYEVTEDEYTWTQICVAIGECTNIEKLNLSGNIFSIIEEERIEILTSQLCKCKKLISLDFSVNALSDESWIILALKKILPSCSPLRILDLHGNYLFNLNSSEWNTLMELIETHPNLDTVDLSFNYLGRIKYEQLEALGKSKIRSLHLGANELNLLSVDTLLLLKDAFSSVTTVHFFCGEIEKMNEGQITALASVFPHAVNCYVIDRNGQHIDSEKIRLLRSKIGRTLMDYMLVLSNLGDVIPSVPTKLAPVRPGLAAFRGNFLRIDVIRRIGEYLCDAEIINKSLNSLTNKPGFFSKQVLQLKPFFSLPEDIFGHARFIFEQNRRLSTKDILAECRALIAAIIRECDQQRGSSLEEIYRSLIQDGLAVVDMPEAELRQEMQKDLERVNGLNF